MPVKIVRNDITAMLVDAIVCPANAQLAPGGGLSAAIHSAAGKRFTADCAALGGCKTGQAKFTKAYDLSCRYVIHTVGPVWKGGHNDERRLLCSCYLNSLELAKRLDCKSIAFPLISTGGFGYPKAEAFKLAMDTVSAFLLTDDGDMEVYIAVFDPQSVQIGEKLFSGIEKYIDDNYVSKYVLDKPTQRPDIGSDTTAYVPRLFEEDLCYSYSSSRHSVDSSVLERELRWIDEGFSEMLLRKISEKGMSDAQCYKRANIDRKLFSKIRSNPAYRPRKHTAIALAIALELSLEETKELLMKAGFALSHSSKFDIIVEYFIKNKIYDIYTTNEALFKFDQPLLGI